MSLIPREIFKEVTEHEGADRYYKKLKSIDPYITMFYAVLTRNSSLREECTNISFIAKSLIPSPSFIKTDGKLFKQIKQNFELKYFLSDSENGIKIQIWVAMILNRLFTLLHRKRKEAEDFSTLVMVAAKNLCSYLGPEEFLLNSKAYGERIFKTEPNKMQTEFLSSG